MGQKELSKEQIPALGQYWFVMYSKGLHWQMDLTSKSKIEQKHLDYSWVQLKAGKLISAGPFTDKINWTGCLIYNCQSKEEVEKIAEADPLVSSKIVSYEIHPWKTH